MPPASDPICQSKLHQSLLKLMNGQILGQPLRNWPWHYDHHELFRFRAPFQGDPPFVRHPQLAVRPNAHIAHGLRFGIETMQIDPVLVENIEASRDVRFRQEAKSAPRRQPKPRVQQHICVTPKRHAQLRIRLNLRGRAAGRQCQQREREMTSGPSHHTGRTATIAVSPPSNAFSRRVSPQVSTSVVIQHQVDHDRHSLGPRGTIPPIGIGDNSQSFGPLSGPLRSGSFLFDPVFQLSLEVA